MTAPLTMERDARDRRIAEFNEAVTSLVEFAISDGEMRSGRRSRQTNDLSRWLRAQYREALEPKP